MREGLARSLRGFGYAASGLSYLARTQPNFLIHLAVTTVVLVLAVALRVPAPEGAVLALTVGLVLGLEAVNTAIEATIDRVGTEHHPLAGAAKDVAAAGVLVAAIAAVVVGCLILGPRLLAALAS